MARTDLAGSVNRARYNQETGSYLEPQYSNDLAKVWKGLMLDVNVQDQPEDCPRYVLNGVNEQQDGQQLTISNENGNAVSFMIPVGYYPIGDRYTTDNEIILLLVNPTTNASQIGIVSKNNTYATAVDSSVLGFNIGYQCDIQYRLRQNEKTIYWVDALNNPRTFNFQRPSDYYNATYAAYLKAGGDPNTYPGEKWQASAFNLIKQSSTIPYFTSVNILEQGAIVSGSYNFAIRYLDADLNPTAWLNTSMTIDIFVDSLTNPYEKIRGSRNNQSPAQSFPKANKSIQLGLSNLDTTFPFYQIAVIPCNNNDGSITKTLVSTPKSTAQGTFLYSGDDTNYSVGSLSDILVGQQVIFSPAHIEQIDNRLILANTAGTDINWCEYQAYASKIGAECVLQSTILNSAFDPGNQKNANSTFSLLGYMPGEVYSFGVVYLVNKNGSLIVSPVFHIPGRGPANTTSNMGIYQATDKYLDIHNCSVDNYWAKDVDGNELVGTSIRHHKFPFRSDLGIPLYTRSTSGGSVQQYTLTFQITLNPAYTGGPIEWPVDGSGNPLVIPWNITYQQGTASPVTVSGTVSSGDLGNNIVAYQNPQALTAITPDANQIAITGVTEEVVQKASGSISDYLTGVNPLFLISGVYSNQTLQNLTFEDTTQLLGIQFNNILPPDEDVVGFFIVRNERLATDRIILDNAIFGPLVQSDPYKAFGLVMPKQYYPAPVVDGNCNVVGTSNSGQTLEYYNQGCWMWNPEYQFLGNTTNFQSIKTQGRLVETMINLPSRSPNWYAPTWEPQNGCTDYRGEYLLDVQAGTTYNSAVNTGPAPTDGFDMIIGFRESEVQYDKTFLFDWPTVSNQYYLSAAAYQVNGADTFYNTSTDNKIAILKLATTIDTTPFYDPDTINPNTGLGTNGLIYGSLINSQTNAYADFISRNYFKETNNPFMFDGSGDAMTASIFNGDASVSPVTLTSTVFDDILAANRKKKNGIWSIIAGAVLIVAGVVADIFTFGAATPAIVAGVALVSAAAIAYGASQVMSGIKIDQLVSMYNVDFPRGLKNTVTDGAVYECIRDPLARGADTMRWFTDTVNSFYVESAVPFTLRSGLTAGISDFFDAPAIFNEQNYRNYLDNKLTVIDTNNAGGRLANGYATAEYYDMNPDYMRYSQQQVYNHLSASFDCCNDVAQSHPNRVWYSNQSFQDEQTDNYSIFLPNDYTDIQGENGEITDLFKVGNSLFVHTREALWQLPQNVQERVTNEIVTFLGTGDFFSIPPRKVTDDDKGSCGTGHKWASIKTKNGFFFIDDIERKMYLLGESPKNIAENGLRNWLKENMNDYLNTQYYDQFGEDYPFRNNPANPNGIGYTSVYDTRHERLIVTKRDYEYLGDMSQVTVGPTGVWTVGGNPISFTDGTKFRNRSWTLSYSFYSQGWISWHSYLPLYYLSNQKDFFSLIGTNSVWKHNIPGLYNSFYGVTNPFIVEYISVQNPINTRIWEDMVLLTRARQWDPTSETLVDAPFITFNKIVCYNDVQSTGEQNLAVKETQAQPSKWLFQQITDSQGKVVITRKERNWNLNNIRDYAVDPSLPIWNMSWAAIQGSYPIDKVPNTANVNFSKDWSQRQVMRDKFLVVRLKFDTFTNVSLSFNFSVTTEQTSNR